MLIECSFRALSIGDWFAVPREKPVIYTKIDKNHAVECVGDVAKRFINDDFRVLLYIKGQNPQTLPEETEMDAFWDDYKEIAECKSEHPVPVINICQHRNALIARLAEKLHREINNSFAKDKTTKANIIFRPDGEHNLGMVDDTCEMLASIMYGGRVVQNHSRGKTTEVLPGYRIKAWLTKQFYDKDMLEQDHALERKADAEKRQRTKDEARQEKLLESRKAKMAFIRRSAGKLVAYVGTAVVGAYASQHTDLLNTLLEQVSNLCSYVQQYI